MLRRLRKQVYRDLLYADGSLKRQGLRRDSPRWMMHDYALDHLEFSGELAMFETMENGQIVEIRCIDFPYVGRVVRFTDGSVTLQDAVKILWDGRHGEYAAGKPPATAEIEKTLPLMTISADAILSWGEYPGGKIPKAQ